jgi:hypothetical protein
LLYKEKLVVQKNLMHDVLQVESQAERKVIAARKISKDTRDLTHLSAQKILLQRNDALLSSPHATWIAAPENPKQAWVAVPVPASDNADFGVKAVHERSIHMKGRENPALAKAASKQKRITVKRLRSVTSKLQLLRKKAFDDLYKAKAEINKLELESGENTRMESDDYVKGATATHKVFSKVTNNDSRKIIDGGYKSASWAAIPVPAAAQRHDASKAEASIVAELFRDIMAESLHPSNAHSHAHVLKQKDDDSVKADSTASLAQPQLIRTNSRPKSDSFDSGLSSLAASDSSSKENHFDEALSADQAEKAAEAAQLREQRSAECKACLDKWSSGARFCVMTVCHLHTSASLLAAPKVP